MKRSQPKLRDERGRVIPRVPGWSALDPRVREAIDRDRIRFSRMVSAEVSTSWTIHSALAAFYGVDIVMPAKPVRRVRVVKFPVRRRA